MLFKRSSERPCEKPSELSCKKKSLVRNYIKSLVRERDKRPNAKSCKQSRDKLTEEAHNRPHKRSMYNILELYDHKRELTSVRGKGKAERKGGRKNGRQTERKRKRERENLSKIRIMEDENNYE